MQRLGLPGRMRWSGRTRRLLRRRIRIRGPASSFALSRFRLVALALLLFGGPASILGSLLLAIVFLFDAPAVLGLHALALATFRLETLGLLAHGIVCLAPLGIDLILRNARLFLQHVALDVRLLLTHFDVDRARTTLRARELQLRLRLALQSDLARCSCLIASLGTVRATQMREELQFRIVSDAIVGPFHLDPRLIELDQQPVDRHLQDFGKL
jgi:hypothetical protein